MARFRSSSFKKNLYHFEEGKEVTITTLNNVKAMLSPPEISNSRKRRERGKREEI